MNTFPWQQIHATIEELLDMSFSVQPVSCRREVYVLYVYPLIVARQWLSKHIPVATNTHTIIEELLAALFSMPSVISKESR